MDDSFNVTLDRAADELGVPAIDLFAHAVRGTFWAGVIGTTWVTTRQEIERINSQRLLPVTVRDHDLTLAAAGRR